MNFKKFIGGISALAIAATAFASMAVTASADYSDEAGLKTWDFSDYSAENANYNVFEVVGGTEQQYASITTAGISFNRSTPSNATPSTYGYVTFTASENGYLTVTFVATEGSSNRNGDGYIYADANGSDLLKATGTLAGKTADSPATPVDVTINVTSGTKYYLFGRCHASQPCSVGITKVTLKPFNTDFSKPTELEFLNPDLFEAVNGAKITESSIYTRINYDTFSPATSQAAKFTAPGNGKIDITFNNGYSNADSKRYLFCYVYSSDGTELAKSSNSIPNGEESSLSYDVTEGTVYYLTMQSQSKDPCDGNITKILFTPDEEEPQVDPPTVTATQDGEDYTSETGDDKKDSASVWKLVVTAGTNAIESIGAKVNDTEGDKSVSTNLATGSTATIGLVINKEADFVKTIDAVIDGQDYNAYTAE